MKFVHMMRRQYEFSVDSFQVHLDAVLLLTPSTAAAAATESALASPKAAPIAIPVPSGESQQPPVAPVRSCPSPKDTESDPGYASDGGGSTDELAASFRRRLTLSSGGSASGAQREDGALSPSSDLPFAETPAELFPSVVVESLYGDIDTAVMHLRGKVIK